MFLAIPQEEIRNHGFRRYLLFFLDFLMKNFIVVPINKGLFQPDGPVSF
jgi:hypothetical protein